MQKLTLTGGFISQSCLINRSIHEVFKPIFSGFQSLVPRVFDRRRCDADASVWVGGPANTAAVCSPIATHTAMLRRTLSCCVLLQTQYPAWKLSDSRRQRGSLLPAQLVSRLNYQVEYYKAIKTDKISRRKANPSKYLYCWIHVQRNRKIIIHFEPLIHINTPRCFKQWACVYSVTQIVNL